jgi:broad specificity phosphatase PhoE
MSLLTIVRHGQASFFSDNYDQLSSIGQEQSRRLAEYWIRQGYCPDVVYAGPRVRQRHTAEIVGEIFLKAGRGWPGPIQLAELDEYSSELFHENFLRKLVDDHEHLRVLEQAYQRAEGNGERLRTFQRLFEATVLMWVHGKIAAPGVETWDAFANRVKSAVRRMVDVEGHGLHIAAFTSAGPACVMAQMALGIPSEKALRLSWLVRNSALAHFLFTKGRFSLSEFNSTPHLAEPRLTTYW